MEQMLQCGVVHPSTSLWAAPVFLVRTDRCTTRFCVDYHQLNDLTRKDVYPLPRINDPTLDALSGVQVFSLQLAMASSNSR